MSVPERLGEPDQFVAELRRSAVHLAQRADVIRSWAQQPSFELADLRLADASGGHRFDAACPGCQAQFFHAPPRFNAA